MKRLSAVVAILLACLPACADGWNTRIEWDGWRIISNEYLYLGRKHTSYPLTYLVDGDPRTTWVFSGNQDSVRAGTFHEGKSYRQWIQIEGNVVADSVWIMNGYNRSPELFKRNNRISQVQLEVNGKPVKTVNLTDKMGWHQISIPRQRVRTLRIIFTKLIKGRDDDTCVSEIALYDGKKQIDFGLTKMVLFTPGAEVGEDGTFQVIWRSGKKVFGWDADAPHEWSPSRRRLAGVDSSSGKLNIFVVDVVGGRVIYHEPVRLRSEDDVIDYDGLAWKGESTLVVTIIHETGSAADRWTEYTETIRLDQAK